MQFRRTNSNREYKWFREYKLKMLCSFTICERNIFT